MGPKLKLLLSAILALSVLRTTCQPPQKAMAIGGAITDAGGIDLAAAKCTTTCLKPGQAAPRVPVSWSAVTKTLRSLRLPSLQSSLTVRLVLPKTVDEVNISVVKAGHSSRFSLADLWTVSASSDLDLLKETPEFQALAASYQQLAEAHPAVKWLSLGTALTGGANDPLGQALGVTLPRPMMPEVLTTGSTLGSSNDSGFTLDYRNPIALGGAPIAFQESGLDKTAYPPLLTADDQAIVGVAAYYNGTGRVTEGWGIKIKPEYLNVFPKYVGQDNANIRDNREAAGAILQKANPDAAEFVRINWDAAGTPTVTDVSAEVEAAYAAYRQWVLNSLSAMDDTLYALSTDSKAIATNLFAQTQVRRFLPDLGGGAWIDRSVAFTQITPPADADPLGTLLAYAPTATQSAYTVDTSIPGNWNFYDIRLPYLAQTPAYAFQDRFEFVFTGTVQQTTEEQFVPAQLFLFDLSMRATQSSPWNGVPLLTYWWGRGFESEPPPLGEDDEPLVEDFLMRGPMNVTASNYNPIGITGNSRCKVSVPANSAGVTADTLDRYNSGTDLGFSYNNDLNNVDANPYPSYDVFYHNVPSTGILTNGPWRFEDQCDQVAVRVPPVEPCAVPKFKFEIAKVALNCDVGQPECGLPGAEFALYDQDPSVMDAAGNRPEAIAGALTADTSGHLFVSSELPAGDYWLVESKSPSGFSLLPQPVKLHLSATGVALLSGDGDGLVSVTTSGTGADLISVVKVVNTARFELPQTGGFGVGWYVGIGVLLMLVGVGSRFSSGYGGSNRRTHRD